MTTKKKTEAKVEAGKEPSFEKSLQRLEQIVEEMEGGAMGLEKMMEHFEEGQRLIKFCAGKLNEVERKIEILIRKGDDVVAEPFEADAAARGNDPAAADDAQSPEKDDADEEEMPF